MIGIKEEWQYRILENGLHRFSVEIKFSTDKLWKPYLDSMNIATLNEAKGIVERAKLSDEKKRLERMIVRVIEL